MTITEKTISMIKTLPDADLLQVQKFVQKLQRKHDPIERYFPPITDEQFRENIQKAREQIAHGESKEMSLVLEQFREEYGL